MIPLLGMVIVFGSVMGGFALENGHPSPLVQPAEILVICGSAVGVLIVSNPMELLRKTFTRLPCIFRSPRPTRQQYLSTLVLLRRLFERGRREGAMKLEDEVDHPQHSAILRRFSAEMSDPEALNVVCDTLRLTCMTRIEPFDLEALLLMEAEAQGAELAAPVRTLETIADALPGLGIISAVLGVVITMSSLREAPDVIGRRVGMALVGTFLGIFLSYGFVAPMAAHLELAQEAEARYFGMLRATLLAFGKGMPAAIALEFGRRAIPPDLRPGFAEMEAEFKASAKVSEKVLTIQ